MTTTEKLQRIRAKCVELAATYPPCESVSAFNSTIAAIDQIWYIEKLADHWHSLAKPLKEAVIAAWPEELFTNAEIPSV